MTPDDDVPPSPTISREEFEELKRQVKALLEAQAT
jgi:hypothetical protein